MSTYEQQVSEHADRLHQVTALTHEQYIAALSALIVDELKAAELLLDRYQLPAPGRWCDRDTCSSPEAPKQEFPVG